MSHRTCSSGLLFTQAGSNHQVLGKSLAVLPAEASREKSVTYKGSSEKARAEWTAELQNCSCLEDNWGLKRKFIIAVAVRSKCWLSFAPVRKHWSRWLHALLLSVREPYNIGSRSGHLTPSYLQQRSTDLSGLGTSEKTLFLPGLGDSKQPPNLGCV